MSDKKLLKYSRQICAAKPAFAVVWRVSEPYVSDYGSRLERQAVAAIDDDVLQGNNRVADQPEDGQK